MASKQLATTILIIINALFVLLGAVLIAVAGVVFQLFKGRYGFLNKLGNIPTVVDDKLAKLEGSSVLENLALCIMLFGCLVFIIAAFGLAGACTQSTCFLYPYAIILGILLAAEITLGALAYLFKDKLKSKLHDYMNSTLVDHYTGVNLNLNISLTLAKGTTAMPTTKANKKRQANYDYEVPDNILSSQDINSDIKNIFPDFNWTQFNASSFNASQLGQADPSQLINYSLNDIGQVLIDSLEKQITTLDPLSIAWDVGMTTLQCCGVDKPSDIKNYAKKWLNTINFTVGNIYKESKTIQVSPTCCKEKPGTAIYQFAYIDIQQCIFAGQTNSTNQGGCYGQVLDMLDKYATNLLIACFAIFVVMFISFFASICLIHIILEDKAEKK